MLKQKKYKVDRGKIIPVRCLEDSPLGGGIMKEPLGMRAGDSTPGANGFHSDSANASLRACGGTPAKLSYR